uniref:LITAF domain-containing protein n=1 Tax=Arion vulgaris TaxID=1028688 RepID=A0A0B6Y075_9EUPU
MSDRTPIIKPSAPPPTYVQTATTATTSLNNQAPDDFDSTDAPPPPYTPSSTYSYDHVIPNSGQTYQRFDVDSGSQVDVITLCQLGPNPCQIQCPSCGQFVVTITYHRAGTLTFISATLCFLFCIICTFLPFCVDELQDVDHRCPNCKYYFGTFTRI